MPNNHQEIGEIVLVVGSYETAAGESKKRYRKVGTLMQSTEDNGELRFWGKLNAEVLQPALFGLCARNSMKKGDDQVNFNVFEPREPNSPTKQKPAGDEEPVY